MKKQFSLVLAAILFAFAFQFCGDKKESAIEYNDKIVGEQMNIVQKMFELTNTFQDKNPKEMDKKLEELKEQIDESLEVLAGMEGFEGDTELLDAATELFKFYKDMVANEFTEMIEILKKGEKNITQEDYDRLYEMQESISQREATFDENMARAQQNFAKKYNVQIQKNQMQDEIDNMGN